MGILSTRRRKSRRGHENLGRRDAIVDQLCYVPFPANAALTIQEAEDRLTDQLRKPSRGKADKQTNAGLQAAMQRIDEAGRKGWTQGAKWLATLKRDEAGKDRGIAALQATNWKGIVDARRTEKKQQRPDLEADIHDKLHVDELRGRWGTTKECVV